MDGKTVLVLGSQGFLGSYICRDLLSNGYSIVGIDNYSKYGKVKRGHDDNPNFRLYQFDLEQRNGVLDKLLEGDFDYIIHGAAKIGGIKYFHKYAFELLAANERMTERILTTLLHSYRWRKRPFPRFIYISSSMVFENATIFPSKESDLEFTPPPRSSYGFQKLMGERWVKAANQQYGLPYTIIRPFNAVGIGEEDDFTKIKDNDENCSLSHVLPDFVYKSLIKQQPFKILGNGEQSRCFTHAADIARGIRLAMESGAAVNEDFNISTAVPTTIFSLSKMVWERINGNMDGFEPKFVEGFRDDVKERIPAINKACAKLGFMAEISLSQSIDEVTEFIKGKIN